MAWAGDVLEFSVAALVEDVLEEQARELADANIQSKNDEETALRRNEATRWLRKSVGVVAAKDLPAEPSEENFRMGLRSGIILCNVLNKTQPGAIPKLVEAPMDSVIVPDGAPLCTCPYFKNLRNFLVAIEEMGIPTFDVSDLEQGGNSSRVVDCVLALKSYSDWKKEGGEGTWKYEGDSNSATGGKPIVPKNSEILKQIGDLLKDLDGTPFYKRVREILLDKKPEDIPIIVENMLSKLMAEFEQKLEKEKEQIIIKQNIIRENIIKENMLKEKSRAQANESLARTQNEFRKRSFSDIKSQMENKANSENKKDESVKSSFSDIKKEMERKSSEKKEEFVKRSFSDIKKEMERKSSEIKQEEFVKPSTIDKNNDVEKKSNPWIKKEEPVKPADVNNEAEKKVNPWMKKEFPIKPSSDINNEVEKKVNPWIKKEESVKPSSNNVNKEVKEKVSSEIKKEEPLKPSSSDIDNEAKKTASPEIDKGEDVEPSSSDINDELEEDLSLEINEEEDINPSSSDSDNDTEENESSESEESAESEDIEPSFSEMDKEMDVNLAQEMLAAEELKAAEQMKAAEKEMKATEERKKRMDAQCQALKDKAAKQKEVVEHQHKELQELKNTLFTAKTDMQSLRTSHVEEVNNLGKHLKSLAQAAAGYKKVLDENRKLYNQVQDLKGNIRVYCRSRPFIGGPGNKVSSVEYVDEVTMAVITYAKNGKETKKNFTFNRVFGPRATQAEVFSDTQPLIRSVLDGYNVCIFAYGQTGSGKTFTMSGPNDLTPETMGVNYRALNDLFDISEERKNMIAYEVSVQMLEIYNEQVRDLLLTDGSVKKLEIRNGAPNRINVPDANLVPVSKTEDVIRLMNLGFNNRSVGSTAMNERSSRSHSCVTVHVCGKDLTTGTTVRGCMHLVDLAGSERADKTEATGDRMKEAQYINKSLSALGDVIASLSSKSSHVPYRNSKLTQLLQDALGGQAKTLMFIHVSPDPDTVGETLSTLKFAERVSTVELGAAKSNKDNVDVRELKEQIACLKAALAKMGGDHTTESVNSPEAGKGGFGNGVAEDIDESDNTSECSESDVQPKVSSSKTGIKKPSPLQAKTAAKGTPTATTRKVSAATSASSAPKTAKSTLDAKKRVGK